VDQSARYLARETLPRKGVGEYTVKGRSVRLTHGTQDTAIFQEIFTAGFYQLPASVNRDLASMPALRVADLGGNIGMFALWAAIQWPACDLIAFEPDPLNAHKYRRFLSSNHLYWELLEACAAAHEGTVAFSGGLESESKISADGEVRVRAVDAFARLATVDLIKMDIEGGEWDLLLDDRFPNLPAQVLMMEYHPHMCPTDDPRALAESTLTRAGYEVEPIFHAPEGHGMLRAIRAGR